MQMRKSSFASRSTGLEELSDGSLAQNRRNLESRTVGNVRCVTPESPGIARRSRVPLKELRVFEGRPVQLQPKTS